MEQPPRKRSDDIYARIQPVLAAVDPQSLAQLVERIALATRVFLLGAGQTGLVLRMLAMRLCQMGLQAYLPGDCTTPAIRPGDLLLVASRSGSRPGVLTLTLEAKKAGATVALLTASPDSPLAAQADSALLVTQQEDSAAGKPLLLGTGFELTLQFLVILLSEELFRHLGLTESSLQARHANLE